MGVNRLAAALGRRSEKSLSLHEKFSDSMLIEFMINVNAETRNKNENQMQGGDQKGKGKTPNPVAICGFRDWWKDKNYKFFMFAV